MRLGTKVLIGMAAALISLVGFSAIAGVLSVQNIMIAAKPVVQVCVSVIG